MFMTYCVACHGKDGKGGGPAAAALKRTPSDLTTLAARNGGKFPELRVYAAIHGDGEVVAHGSKEMPVWGEVFQSMSRDSGAGKQMRVANLTAYIKSIQAK
jgi:mono/diheme cytochrome c family protein